MNPQDLIKKGELLFEQGNFPQAEEHFLRVIGFDPVNKEALNNLGVLAFARGDAENALAFFAKAIDSDPVYLDALVNLSELLQSTGSPADAFPFIERASRLAPRLKEIQELRDRIIQGSVTGNVGQTSEHGEDVQNEAAFPEKTSTRQMPLRVIHLPLVIANNAITLSKYLNRLGIDSKVISYFRTWLNYEGDINLELDGLNAPERNKKVREFVDYFFTHEANKYDIFHFHFFDSLSTGASFGGWKSHPDREDYWDLRKFKEMGKKIVVSSWGSDVRNNSKLVYYQLKYEDPTIDIHYPPLNRKDQYLKIWKFARYADAIIHGDCETVKHTPYGNMIPIGIDLEPFDLLMQGYPATSEDTSILYAPSNQFYKGTIYTEAVLKRVSARYANSLEIRKIHGLPYREAIKRYLGHGAAVDDIAIFSFGLFALEAMYLGRTVFTTLCEEEFFGEDPKLDAPVISVHSEEEFFQNMVAYLDGDRADALETNQSFIRERCSASIVARQYQCLYERLMAGERIEQFVSQAWDRELHRLLAGLKVDEGDYYPQVTDILLKKREYGKLMHEVQMGMGLNNDIDMLAKYICALEAAEQGSQSVSVRKNNEAVISTAAFKETYQRARELAFTHRAE